MLRWSTAKGARCGSVADRDARASVVIQDQIAAALSINSAHVAADRIRSALQYALIGAVSRKDRVKESERCLRRDTRDQWECHDHDTTAGLFRTGGKVVADGRVLKSKRAIQREDRRAGIRAIARPVRARIVDSALPPVHIVMGERAVADDNRTAVIEDGASESSTPTATATAVTTSSERARVSGSAVRINVGADAEACAAAKSAISSMTATEERPVRP